MEQTETSYIKYSLTKSTTLFRIRVKVQAKCGEIRNRKALENFELYQGTEETFRQGLTRRAR